ncbi:MAG: hypothetical protein K2X11_02435 [Acetobacteraceae bacterium]|nr:hypothetical protein [Acetobacteraceae bacterium]
MRRFAMRRFVIAALPIAALAAGDAAARGGPAQLRDCVAAGFFEIAAVTSSANARSADGTGGGFSYAATIRTRETQQRGFRVDFTAPGATSATNPQGYSLANRQSRTITLGTTPAGTARLTDAQIRDHTRVMCWA